MPLVKLKINCWLNQGLDANSAGFEEIAMSVSEGQAVLEIVRRLTAENGIFRRAIYDEKERKSRRTSL